ncbi:hypothetical protein F6Y02_36435 [Bacillus megaterium]|nr:hypothetical protein [Priestia megaterium]
MGKQLGEEVERAYYKAEEYDKSSTVNQFAFTVENFHEATNHDREKGAEFYPQTQPTLEILF